MSSLNTAFALIFGGCCSNVFTLEAIVKHQPNTGLIITVVQFALTSLFALPSQLHRPSSSSAKLASNTLRIARPSIPLPRLALLALLFFSVNMLNNWAFAFNISVPMHIILRSFGSVQTMAVGWCVGKRYSRVQVGSVVVLTIGVIVSAWADAVGKGKINTSTFTTTSSTTETSSSSSQSSSYTTGLALLFTAQLIAAYLGVLTEQTYTTYGRHWGEVLFYSHFFGLLFSLVLLPTLLSQYQHLTSQSSLTHRSSAIGPAFTFLPASLARYTPTHPLTLLLLNALTQVACISGVNRLSAGTTAVTVTVVLNIRKLVSFLLSCVVFGNRIGGLMGLGAGLVFCGGAVYGWDSSRGRSKEGKKENVVGDGDGLRRQDGGVDGNGKGSAIERDVAVVNGVARRRGGKV